MASEVLQDLAQGFLDQGCILQGMKCLEALCGSSLQLPASAARTRLQVLHLASSMSSSACAAATFLSLTTCCTASNNNCSVVSYAKHF